MTPDAMFPAIGQECICPDGLGWVKAIQRNRYGAIDGVVVETRFNNRDCCWAPHNVRLMPLPMFVPVAV